MSSAGSSADEEAVVVSFSMSDECRRGDDATTAASALLEVDPLNDSVIPDGRDSDAIGAAAPEPETAGAPDTLRGDGVVGDDDGRTEWSTNPIASSSISSSTINSNIDGDTGPSPDPSPSSPSSPFMPPEDAVCRVCHCEAEIEAGRPLFHPCRCSGSIKYVHEDCLKSWIQISKKPQCELCGETFTFRKVYSQDMPPELSLRDVVAALGPKIVAYSKSAVEVAFPWILYAIIVPLLTYVEIEAALRVVLRAPLWGALPQRVTYAQMSAAWFVGATANVLLLQVMYVIGWVRTYLVVRREPAVRAPPRNAENARRPREEEERPVVEVPAPAPEAPAPEIPPAGAAATATVDQEEVQQQQQQAEEPNHNAMQGVDAHEAVPTEDPVADTVNSFAGVIAPSSRNIDLSAAAASEEAQMDGIEALPQQDDLLDATERGRSESGAGRAVESGGGEGIDGPAVIIKEEEGDSLISSGTATGSIPTTDVFYNASPEGVLDAVDAPIPPPPDGDAEDPPFIPPIVPFPVINGVRNVPAPFQADEIEVEDREQEELNRNNPAAGNDDFGLLQEANGAFDHVVMALGLLAINAAVSICAVIVPVFVGQHTVTEVFQWDLEAHRAALRYLVKEATAAVNAELGAKKALDDATVAQIQAYLTDGLFTDSMVRAAEAFRFWIYGSAVSVAALIVTGVVAYCVCWALGFNVPKLSNPFNANLYRNVVQLIANVAYVGKFVGLVLGEIVILPIATGLLIDFILLRNLGVTLAERLNYFRTSPFSYLALRGTVGGMFIAHLSSVLSAARDCLIPSISQALLLDPEILSVVQRPDQRLFANDAKRNPLAIIMRIVVNLIAIVPGILFMIMIPARLGHHLLLQTEPIVVANDIPDFRTSLPVDMALLHIFTAILNPKYFVVLEKFIRKIIVFLCERAGIAEYVLQDYAMRRHAEHRERQLQEIAEIERLINVFAANAAEDRLARMEALFDAEAAARRVREEQVVTRPRPVESTDATATAVDNLELDLATEMVVAPNTVPSDVSSVAADDVIAVIDESEGARIEPGVEPTDRVAEEEEKQEGVAAGGGAEEEEEVVADVSQMEDMLGAIESEINEHYDVDEEVDLPAQQRQPSALEMAAREGIAMLMFCLCVSVVSAAGVLYPMALGRWIIASAGFSLRNDLYSAALGYLLFIPAGMAANFVGARVSERADVLHFLGLVRDCADLFVKAVIIAVMWGIIIPCCLGLLWNFLVLNAFASLSATTLISTREVYGVGFLCALLSIKGSVVGIELFQPLKQRIDRMRRDGLRNLSYAYILNDMGWTFLLPLLDAIVIPYALGVAVQYALIAMGIREYQMISLAGRYAHLFVLALVVANRLRLSATAAARDLYDQARDSRYLVGVQLANR